MIYLEKNILMNYIFIIIFMWKENIIFFILLCFYYIIFWILLSSNITLNLIFELSPSKL